jgi:hypothetical protein
MIEVERVSRGVDKARRPAVSRVEIQRALREFTEPSLFWGTALALAALEQ